MSKADLDARIDQINRFEAMLVNEGALVLKFWFHLTKDGQKRRLKALEKDPKTAWRVTKWNWDRLKTYDKLQDVVGHVLRMTNTPWAPWIIVEGEDDRYRSLTTGKILLEAIRERLASAGKQTTPVAPPIRVNIDGRNVLSELNLKHKLSEKEYEEQLAKWQGKLVRTGARPALQGAFAGVRLRRATTPPARAAPSAASPPRWTRATTRSSRWPRRPRKNAPSPTCGASGAICRARAGRDLRPHLVRPRAGRARRGLLRRGRLAARLRRDQRLRARPGRRGVIVVKFWLQISQDEQLRRFKEREKIEFKRFKITEEDWRNREKWDAYQEAICDMVDRTSTGTRRGRWSRPTTRVTPASRCCAPFANASKPSLRASRFHTPNLKGRPRKRRTRNP
jgi:polyphosphate kinase 2 (PPK2 family)